MNSKQPNKVKTVPKNNRSATNLSRRAIADFVESNVPRFNRWLQKVADGVPKVDIAGDVVRDKDGSVVWVQKPDPLNAIKLVADICEYHLPKLSRQDLTVHTGDDLRTIETDELVRLRQNLLQNAQNRAVIDVTPTIKEELPSWLK